MFEGAPAAASRECMRTCAPALHMCRHMCWHCGSTQRGAQLLGARAPPYGSKACFSPPTRPCRPPPSACPPAVPPPHPEYTVQRFQSVRTLHVILLIISIAIIGGFVILLFRWRHQGKGGTGRHRGCVGGGGATSLLDSYAACGWSPPRLVQRLLPGLAPAAARRLRVPPSCQPGPSVSCPLGCLHSLPQVVGLRCARCTRQQGRQAGCPRQPPPHPRPPATGPTCACCTTRARTLRACCPSCRQRSLSRRLPSRSSS